MATEQDYSIQVSHTVTENYLVRARSGSEASVALGMHMAGGYDNGDEGTESPVRLVKTTKTVKRISSARTLIDDEAPGTEGP